METADWLFAPGDGTLPPALAGREPEQAVLSQCLAALAGGRSPPHNVVLVGPRGNVKTALLGWFEEACRKASVQVARVVPSRARTEEALRNALLPTSPLMRLLPRKWSVGGVGKAEWEASSAVARDWVERLIRRCRRTPMAVLVDEAHTLDLQVGQILLNVSQNVRAKAPLVLVLAGTPGLFAHLGKMDASFWDRLGDGLLGIGLLSDAAAREALVEPLREQRVCIDAGALDCVIEQSQRYAYFVQLWGQALWNQRLATGETRLTADHVAAALPTVEMRTTDYYQRRYRELEAQELLPAAAAVAPLFQKGMDATATDAEIDTALTASGTESARFAAREHLHRLGYIWCPPGQLPPVVWHPGIPSLTQFVLHQAASA